ncbi:hypothetical protein GIT21_19460 [Salmonella enterica]|uniref:Uncharacterized protein n=43 Tax=Salmonella enterica TaxID=28901 RepID=A0A602F9T0_SALET|nr:MULTISPECIES: hypothetical protein [Salmonella]EAA0713999.1 hypothetical protein [Salmonella enterica subsp. enterica serovar Stanley]EAA1525774.1 hypothetical protein [Salmonella enterica subsp. enterica serovar Tennessee]EAA3233818.1 hypothetical protein [Salmonella enterica subsp. enterica serovar Fluntern]EAA3277327.1 hypothetical protein [Salmonella enterica subsp. enterica serovar Brunei]EAA4011540.1 hypothetical protein [Salmonella enterica subsp. enterica serovar Montevideo]EAA5430
MDRVVAGWLVTVVLAFWAGWKAANWQRDSIDLAISRSASATGETLASVASESGRKLEEQLEALKNAPPREIRTEVVKPVFTNVCLSDDFVRMYNDAVTSTERTLSGKPEN